MVHEVSRGPIVGEMSLHSNEPRSAAWVAIRDSVLVRLSKAAFKRLLLISAQVSIAFTHQIIRRVQIEGSPAALDRPVAMGQLPTTAGVGLACFAECLAAACGSAGLAQGPFGGAAPSARLCRPAGRLAP